MKFFLAPYLLTTFILILATTLPAHGQDTHTVRSGETLYGISRTYDVSVNDILRWNNLEGSTISVGQVLQISENGSGAQEPAEQSSEDVTTHTVEAGETLFRISRQYGVSVGDIRSWNELSSDNLEVGQRLVISGDGVADGDRQEEAISQPSGEAQASRPSQGYHEVARGETLYSISRQYNMSVSNLQSLNNLSSTTLSVGQRLIVDAQRPAAQPSDTGTGDRDAPAVTDAAPADTSVPSGAFVKHRVGNNETIEGLLSRFNMDEEEFNQLNPEYADNEIRPGDEVEILTPQDRTTRNPYRVSTNLDSGGDIAVTVYDPQQKGSTTTSGDLYNPSHLTAAHSSLRLGKVVYIENPSNGKGIFVQINDRVTGNYLKLSEASFNALGFDGDSELSAKIFEELPE